MLARLYLNGYIGSLATAGGLVYFMREQLGKPIPSPVVLGQVGEVRLGGEIAACYQGGYLSFAECGQRSEPCWHGFLFRSLDCTQTTAVKAASPRARGEFLI